MGDKRNKDIDKLQEELEEVVLVGIANTWLYRVLSYYASLQIRGTLIVICLQLPLEHCMA